MAVPFSPGSLSPHTCKERLRLQVLLLGSELGRCIKALILPQLGFDPSPCRLTLAFLSQQHWAQQGGGGWGGREILLPPLEFSLVPRRRQQARWGPLPEPAQRCSDCLPPKCHKLTWISAAGTCSALEAGDEQGWANAGRAGSRGCARHLG